MGGPPIAKSSRSPVSVGVPNGECSPQTVPTVEKMVQYSLRGGGYVPTTETVRKMPAGAYQPTYVYQGNGSFITIKPISIVTDTLIHFSNSVITRIMEDFNWFWDNAEEYKKMEFQHKRGYLLYGPPGAGKSCLTTIAIENIVQRGGIAFVVNEPVSFFGILADFRAVESDRPLLVVLEDVDTIVEERSWEAKLLSILDGEAQVNHVVFIATTNYPETLDKRLSNRPGRFDQRIQITPPEKEIRQQYLEKKIGSIKAPDGSDLVEMTDGLSLGHMRELIIAVFAKRENPNDVVKRLKEMSATPKVAGGESGLGFSRDRLDDEAPRGPRAR